ncbi:hypothetical protein GTO89_06300 [Heliobacterium gestii]|uniref:Uncharacterized protein n=1 Tax=Heliomicrobium gestii TaxID=2699 RepID=A0A845L8W5_HELGE|nr:hypothetical protein [Heliomicrobium gestii]MBM7866019.1 hypothetical protein [Heliomicrobium gestii]MZP42648.1 hypothetical protein [Heliomicrobium gestii]
MNGVIEEAEKAFERLLPELPSPSFSRILASYIATGDFLRIEGDLHQEVERIAREAFTRCYVDFCVRQEAPSCMCCRRRDKV